MTKITNLIADLRASLAAVSAERDALKQAITGRTAEEFDIEALPPAVYLEMVKGLHDAAERLADYYKDMSNEPTPAPVPTEGATMTAEQAWEDLINKDDRTSPEEFPDMALITREELSGYILAAIAAKHDECNKIIRRCWGENLSMEVFQKAIELLDADRSEAPAPKAVKQPSFDWYWPEDDTSSDACADGPWQIAENIDAEPGEVFGYARGGVVEVRYFGSLPAADDSDSDDDFEVDEPTREAAEERMAAEVARRAALANDAEG